MDSEDEAKEGSSAALSQEQEKTGATKMMMHPKRKDRTSHLKSRR